MFKPRCSVTPKILTAISEIAEIKAVVERSKVLPLNEAHLKRQAIARMAHTSTSIEGNKLAQFQVDKVLSGMSVSGDAKSILEVKNIQNAINEMDKIVESGKAIGVEDVLKLHGILMRGLVESEKCGYFRKDDIYVVDDLGDGREKLRYKGPDHTTSSCPGSSGLKRWISTRLLRLQFCMLSLLLSILLRMATAGWPGF